METIYETYKQEDILKQLENKGLLTDFEKENIQNGDYELYEDYIDLITQNTQLQPEDIEEVIQWLCYDIGEEEEKNIYDNYLDSTSYNTYTILDNGYVLFYDREIPQF